MLRSTFIVAVAVPLIASISLAENVAFNPGFEIEGPGGDGDALGWFSSPGNNGVSERDSSEPFSGEWAYRLLATGEQVGVSQRSGNEQGLASLAPGTDVEFSLMYLTRAPGNAAALVYVAIVNRNGEIVSDPGNPFNLFDSNDSYLEMSIGPLTVPESSDSPNDYYEAVISFAVFPNSRETVEIFIDDVVIEATLVPEPSILAALFWCVFPLACRLRRRR